MVVVASPIDANNDTSSVLRLESRLQAVLWETIPPEGGTPNQAAGLPLGGSAAG